MRLATDQKSQPLLEHKPPRPLPLSLTFTLLLDYLAEHPWSTCLDPLLLNGLVAALAMALLPVPWPLWAALGIIMGIRLSVVAWPVATHVYGSYRLLKYGRVIHARILWLRPAHNSQGKTSGAHLDCAIPIANNRTSLVSAWIPSRDEAERLQQQKYLRFLCLEHAPGTCLLLEACNPRLRYYSPVVEWMHTRR